MKKDLIKLRRKTLVGVSHFKPGDLVFTAEIHRVVGPFKEGRYGEFRVVTVWPECEACKGHAECCHVRIMTAGCHSGGGQQGIMKVEVSK